ncbi:MAG: potassium channel protein [Kofleriaceae bacterium]|nr:potassium channel protein [Kofleriaceae bacterium]MBP6837948.1 potassium channel protein [Kofleriaceae bacterium]MBP9208034.1 potassium channel protein [Kofleriaceae bacterium]
MTPSLRNRMLAGFVAMLVVVAGGSLGFYLIGEGRWSWFDCLYMTIITVTTVGYGEVLPGMEDVPYARPFAIVQLVFGTGVLVYFASTITAFIVEGDLRNLLLAQRLKKRIKRMKDHVIVCGAGSTGRHIIEELLTAGNSVVGIDTVETPLREVIDHHPGARFSYLVGDATDDEVLAQAGLPAARGVVAALSSDKDNLYVCVSTRLTNPGARVIARCSELSHVEKIKRAGADAVVSPNYIGGMRMVSELLRPAVVRFLDEMLRDTRATYRIDEVRIPAESTLDGATLREANIRERFGMTVLALRPSDDQPWQYNPDAGQRLKGGMVLVVLGSTDQVAKLRGVLA